MVGAPHTHTHTPELLGSGGCVDEDADCDSPNERDTCTVQAVKCHRTTPCLRKNSASDVNTANESCLSTPQGTERPFRLTRFLGAFNGCSGVAYVSIDSFIDFPSHVSA